MKTLLLLLVLGSLLFPRTSIARGEDKELHVAASYVLTLALYGAGRALCEGSPRERACGWALGVVGTAIVGMGKERFDRAHDTADLAADGVGIGLGSLSILAVDF